jgi:hypothetical protein
VRIVEADLVEFGPTPTPAYKGTLATTSVRSHDPPDEQHVGITHDLAPNERWVTRSKPGTSGAILQRERVTDGELASWERESDPWWLIRDMAPVLRSRMRRHEREWWHLA